MEARYQAQAAIVEDVRSCQVYMKFWSNFIDSTAGIEHF